MELGDVIKHTGLGGGVYEAKFVLHSRVKRRCVAVEHYYIHGRPCFHFALEKG